MKKETKNLLKHPKSIWTKYEKEYFHSKEKGTKQKWHTKLIIYRTKKNSKANKTVHPDEKVLSIRIMNSINDQIDAIIDTYSNVLDKNNFKMHHKDDPNQIHQLAYESFVDIGAFLLYLSNPFNQNINYSANIGRWNKLRHATSGKPTDYELKKYPMHDVS
jgi:hypothetical protein